MAVIGPNTEPATKSDPGRCAIEASSAGESTTCGISYMEVGGAVSCQVGNCSRYKIDCTKTPIKQLIKGAVIAPFVRLRFEGDGTPPNGEPNWDYTEITTGNVSQPCNAEHCRAVIKSFQYGWGNQGNGNVCKVTIYDELGSSFQKWMDRLIKQPENTTSPTNHGVYKMKVTWGWIVTGGNGCPDEFNNDDATCATGASCFFSGTIAEDPAYGSAQAYSTNPNRIICSPSCWFIPDGIVVNMQNGKFIYEIEGKDTMFRNSEHVNQRTYGDSSNKMHFKDAVELLGKQSIPAFNVEFKNVDETTGVVSDDFKFYVPPGTAVADPIIGNSNPNLKTLTELEEKGPIGIWDCKSQPPMAAINNWIISNSVRAHSDLSTNMGRGIVMNYDSTAKYDTSTPGTGGATRGRLLLWGDVNPNCIDASVVNYEGRRKALYIYNGGQCSPVYSFSPMVKYNFIAAMRGGGSMTTTSGNAQTAASLQTLRCQVENNKGLPGIGFNNTAAPSNPLRDLIPETANEKTLESAALQRRANALHNAVEAELRVQGDPSSWLCSPIDGMGSTVALIVINPFYMNQQEGALCPDWTTLTESACNEVLSNPNWQLRGVDHQIKEGSYITTLRIILYASPSEIPPADIGPQALGGAEDAPLLCGQGTYACGDKWPTGYNDGAGGTYEKSADEWAEFCGFTNCDVTGIS